MVCSQPPSQIQYGRRAVHQEELHDDVYAAVPISKYVVMEDKQGQRDTDMMEQEGGIGVAQDGSQGRFGGWLDEVMAETGFTEKADGVLQKVSTFDGCDGITQCRARL